MNTPETATTDYTLRDHMSHMQTMLSTKTMESVVTCGELLGQAPVADERFILMTRSFIQGNRQMGLRGSDLDREIALRRRAAKAAMRSALIAATTTPADTETDIYRWVDECFDQWGVTITGHGALIHPELSAVGAVSALVVLNSQRPKALAFSGDAIRAAFERVMANRRIARLDEVRADIGCDKLDMPREHVMSLFADVMRLGLDAGSPFTPEEAVQIVCKTIWQVKRKLLGLRVTRHLMPVFTGPQGGGKSQFVAAFTSPVEELTVSTDLRTLTDERVISLFENYIGVVDELDKADRANVESLKRIITERTMDRRVMRSNSSVKVQQNLTFIGTSNRDVAEAIVDETGNRRFVSLPITAAQSNPEENLFWDAVNAFKWVDLWRAVDATEPDPTTDIWAKIQAVQASERSRSNIELWVEHASREGDLLAEWTSTADLYLRYRAWEERFAPRAESSFGWWTKAFARMTRQGVIPFTPRKKAEANGYEFNGDVVLRPAAAKTGQRWDANAAISRLRERAARGD